MAQLILEIADELDAALIKVSQIRHRPKSEVAHELLEQILLHRPTAGAAQNWLSNWRGSLQDFSGSPVSALAPEAFLAKHPRHP